MYNIFSYHLSPSPQLLELQLNVYYTLLILYTLFYIFHLFVSPCFILNSPFWYVLQFIKFPLTMSNLLLGYWLQLLPFLSILAISILFLSNMMCYFLWLLIPCYFKLIFYFFEHHTPSYFKVYIWSFDI